MGRYRRSVPWGIALLLGGVILIAVVTSLPDRGGTPDASDEATAPPSPSATTTLATLPSADPGSAAEAFLAAWQAADWPALESAIGPGADVAPAQHAAWFADLDVTSLTLTLEGTSVGATSAEASFVVEVGVGTAGQWRYRSDVALVPDGDGWIVRWEPSVLHPSLGTGDHLDVVVRWPARALIADVAGRSLVADEPEVVVGVIPGRIGSRDELAAAVNAHLGISRGTLDATIDAPGVQPDWYLPIATLQREQYVELRPLLYPVPGIAFRVESHRVPVYGTLGAELIGTTGEITAELLEELGAPYGPGSMVGRSGLERAFETVLAGRPTYDIVRRGAAGDDVVVHGFPGSSGDTLATSISLEAQQAAEAIVADAELPTAVVAIDHATGEIRAAASSPVGGFNEALSGLYAPGSTFKIVVATAALEAGVARDDILECPESITVSGKEFRNAADLPSTLTFEQAFARSCNTAFIELGRSIPAADLADVAGRLGFGLEYNVGLESAGGRFEPSGDVVDYAASMIGQGRVLASPLHMASVAAAVAVGEWRVPSFVAGSQSDPIGAFDEPVMADLRAMMRAVVAGGTGRAAAISGSDVAGKTGTAEVGVGDDARTIAWFVGFDDEMAVAVLVEGGDSGGSAAAPLARDFLLSLDEPVATPGGATACLEKGADWTTFQGLGTRAGCSLADRITDPEVAWSADVGIHAWLNSPLVIGDTVIVGSAGDVRAGPDAEDGVYALDLGTGRLRWHFATGNDVNGIAATEGIVIAVGDEGAAWGIDPATGDELWQVDTPNANAFGYPVIVDDVVFVGDSSGTLWAIDMDGVVRWSTSLDGALRGGASSDGTLVYAVSDLGEVGAFSLDGFEIWRERIVFETNQRSSLAVVYGPPTIVDDRLIVTFSVDGGPGSPGVVAFDRFVGSIAWWGSDPAGVSEARWANVRSSVAVAPDGIVLAGSLSSGIQLLSADGGHALWSADTGVTCGRQWASPVVVGDTIVVPRPDGAVYAFDAADGGVVWRMPLPSRVATTSDCTSTGGLRVADGPELQATVAVAPDGTIVVASLGRAIYAIRNG